MLEPIENAMIIGEDRLLAAMYPMSNTPWDYRKPWYLFQFVYANDMEDEIRFTYLDEDDVDKCLDDLPEDVAIRLIERYIEHYGLIDRYDDWMRGV